jgi:hypothetical protein
VLLAGWLAGWLCAVRVLCGPPCRQEAVAHEEAARKRRELKRMRGASVSRSVGGR